jgi:Tryptophan-rich Synechocystis species C-terminal domain
VWNTDANGNDTTNTIGTVSGSSTALESLETSFHQDLNGDGVIGVVIESSGSTRLTQVGSNYFLYDSSGSGPPLKYLGANIVAGQWGGWAPIGGEATATGYEVAWKLAGADQYTVWNTDANGNDTTNTIGTVPGSSIALESLEISFHQDLNGDGVIGLPTATNASPSSSATQTALVTVASKDTFVFSPSFHAETFANAGGAAPIEHDGFSPPAGNAELAALLNNPQTGQPQAAFKWASDGHDTAINPGSHDNTVLTSLQIADLHANAFFIR